MAGLEEPGDEVSEQAGAATCGADPGACGDAGVGPVCVATGPRDCSSELDNDCDAQPDNVVDQVCVCAVGTSEACDEHPGLDGSGPCLAGLRTCVLAADGLTSEWGACEGAVGPGGPDSCTVRGDDADCDGTPNTDCPCVDGDTQECGSPTNTGPCAIGTSTCVNGRFGTCAGATPPAPQDSCAPGDDSNCNGRANDRFCACLNGATQQCGVTATGLCELGTQTCVNGAFGQCIGARDPGSRDCRSQQDNNCDGRPDNTIDAVCECVPGGGNGPCSDDPNNSRCNDQGKCDRCLADDDCSLVGGGRQFCTTRGQCVARFACGDASPPGPAVVPEFALFSAAAPSTGGTILDGEYVQTVAYTTNIPTTFPAFAIGQGFAFRGQFVHWKGVEFLYEDDPGGPLWDRIGTYSTSGNSITIDWFQCADLFGPSSSGSTTMQYAASQTAIELIGTSSGRFLRR